MAAPRALLAVLLSLLVCASAAAQSFSADVRGTVRDPAGIVAGAAVELTDEATGATRSTTTNADGLYIFAAVPPGSYRLAASAGGHRPYRREGLRLGTWTVLVADLRLELGAPSQTVTVYGDAPPLDTGHASISALLPRALLDRAPSAGRNVFIMSALAPTVLATGDAQFVRQQDQSNSSLISLAGGPRRDNSYVLDGVPVVDILNRAPFIPSLEAVDEMRVQLSAYDAGTGRTSGGVFNTLMRSGTNTWRGSGAYQARPGWAQSRLFFAEKNDLPKGDTYYHLYGGSLGGPLVRGRTFFFASSEGYRSRTTRSTVLVLPTEEQRRGDFSDTGVTIYDPLTTRPDPNGPGWIRDPFPGNRIPADRLNPVATAMLSYLPRPVSGTSRPAVADIVDRADQVVGKLTHRWSDAATSSAMYGWYSSMEPDSRFYGEPIFTNAADPGEGALVRSVSLLAVNTTWTPASRSVVEARYGMSRFLDDNRPAAFNAGLLDFDPAFLRSVPQQKFPSIGVAGYGRGGSLLGDRTQGTATYGSQFGGVSLTSLLGRHTIRAGGEYRLLGVRFLNLGGTGGYSFSRDFTSGPDPNAPGSTTGDAFASFLLGYPSSGSIFVSSPIDVYLRYGAAFVEVDSRLTDALTVNAGLRYEYESGLQERHGRMATGWAFDEPFPIQVDARRPDGQPLLLTGGLKYAGVDGAPTAQGAPDPKQFAPRAGLAYAIGRRSVLRAGYGLYFAPVQGISADEVGSGTQGYNRSTNYLATIENPFVPCGGCSLSNPFPAGIDQPVGGSLGRLTGVGGFVAFVDPGSRLGRLHRFSIQLQHQVPDRVTLEAGYVGARGDRLQGGVSGGPININQLDPSDQSLGAALLEPVPNPFYGTPLGVGILAGETVPRGQLLRPYPQFDTVYATRASAARSRYDALVLSAARRVDRWGGAINYTWSRWLDSQWAESNFFSGGSGLLDNHDVDRDYGLSVLDAPHRLNVEASVELPFGVMVSVLGSYQSGFPVSIGQSPNNANLFGSSQRPNVAEGIEPRLTGDPADSYDPACACIRWLNPEAWTQAPAFTFGNAPRTDGRVRTPTRRNWDVAIQKSQRAGKVTLAMKAEVINVFNFPDFRGPGITFGDATFGQIREAAGFPRTLQLMARASW